MAPYAVPLIGGLTWERRHPGGTKRLVPLRCRLEAGAPRCVHTLWNTVSQNPSASQPGRGHLPYLLYQSIIQARKRKCGRLDPLQRHCRWWQFSFEMDKIEWQETATRMPPSLPQLLRLFCVAGSKPGFSPGLTRRRDKLIRLAPVRQHPAERPAHLDSHQSKRISTDTAQIAKTDLPAFLRN
jgi:hypothetical protein